MYLKMQTPMQQSTRKKFVLSIGAVIASILSFSFVKSFFSKEKPAPREEELRQAARQERVFQLAKMESRAVSRNVLKS